MTALSLSFFSKHSKTSTIWHSSLCFYHMLLSKSMPLSFIWVYFSWSMRHISLKLKVLPYFPKIRMLQTLGKQSFQCSNVFLFLILSFVLSGKTNRLLTVTSYAPFTAMSRSDILKEDHFKWALNQAEKLHWDMETSSQITTVLRVLKNQNSEN